MTPTPAIAEPAKGKVWHHQSVEAVLSELSSASEGLTSAEAAKRLANNGLNELKEAKPVSLLQMVLRQFKSIILWILIAAGVISALLGEQIDAIAIFAIVLLNAIIGFYQEFKAEKSITALKKLTAPQATVRRD